jgi:transmembrane sensor
MTDLESESLRDPVLGRIQPRWGSARTELNLAMTVERIERGRRLRRVGVFSLLGAGAVVAVAVLVTGAVREAPVAGGRFSLTTAALSAVPVEAGPRVLRFAEGSTVSLPDARGLAVVAAAKRDRIEIGLAGGPAAFDVPPAPARSFIVKLARVEIAIASARFVLTPAGDRVEVAVESGSVRASWPGGADVVSAGATAWFPPAPATEPPPASPSHQPTALGLRSQFRLQVARRQYAAAYRSLVAAPGVAEHSAEDLMLAADAARLSGHPAESVPYFRRLLLQYPSDARGPVAAFTLGRILLAELERPGEAAEAFALARRLAPAGTLAPDALAREVEAAARAGERARARTLAEEYVSRYPAGRRAAAVRRWGGIE